MNASQSISLLTPAQRDLLKARLYLKQRLPQPATSDHKRLVAFVRYKENKRPLKREELDAFITASLPAYMLPSIIREKKVFPVNNTGKIDRLALAIESSHTTGSDWPEKKADARDANQANLLSIWKLLLGNPDISVFDNFFKVGGDSILAIRMVAKARQAGISLKVSDIFKNPTITDLTSQDFNFSTPAGIDLSEGPLDLLPIQNWLISYSGLNLNQWNQSVLLEVSPGLEKPDIEKALNILWEHHDGLRMIMIPHNSGWIARIVEVHDRPVSFQHVVADISEGVDLDSCLVQTVNTLHKSTNVELGNLFQAAWMEAKDRSNSFLILVANHLVVDGLSWRIILEDLEYALRMLSARKVPSLPEKTTSIRQWSEAIRAHAKSRTISRSLDFWKNQNYQGCHPLPLDIQGAGLADEGSACTIDIRFSVEETALVTSETHGEECGIPGYILTAYLEGLRKWTGNSAFTIHMEGHGREPISPGLDVSRTVGWFTSVYPVVFDLSFCSEIKESLRETLNILRKVPNKGFDYQALIYHGPKGEDYKFLDAIPPMQLVFNYMGVQEKPEREGRKTNPVRWGIGQERDPTSPLTSMIELNSQIEERCLSLSLKYSTKQLHSATINQIAENLKANLMRLVSGSSTADTIRIPDQRFMDADLDDDELDSLFSQIR